MNHYQRGKAHGATITDKRDELEHYLRILRDRTADTNERYFARGVIMGGAQRLDKSANHLSAAITALGLDKPAKPAPPAGEDLVLAITRAVDEVRDGINKPVWTPLEAVLPYDWCGGFMYMSAHEARILNGSPDGRKRKTIFLYKHGITRRYLFIGDDLQAYTYQPEQCEIGDPAYTWTPMDAAIERVFEDLDDLGAERTTRYDDAFIAERNARLVAAGYQVIS